MATYTFERKVLQWAEIEADSEKDALDKIFEEEVDWEDDDECGSECVITDTDDEALLEDAEYERVEKALYDRRTEPVFGDSYSLTMRARHLMEHAIGLDRSSRGIIVKLGRRYYVPYRNYFDTAPGLDTYAPWSAIEKEGFAEHTPDAADNGGVTFVVTRKGLDWLSSQNRLVIKNPE